MVAVSRFEWLNASISSQFVKANPLVRSGVASAPFAIEHDQSVIDLLETAFNILKLFLDLSERTNHPKSLFPFERVFEATDGVTLPSILSVSGRNRRLNICGHSSSPHAPKHHPRPEYEAIAPPWEP
jgi:hypothetical protein